MPEMGRWLSALRNLQSDDPYQSEPTEPTKAPSVGSVGSVSVTLEENHTGISREGDDSAHWEMLINRACSWQEVDACWDEIEDQIKLGMLTNEEAERLAVFAIEKARRLVRSQDEIGAQTET